MKRDYKPANGSKIAFLIMILLAILSVGLTSATINNYLSASKAASGFRMAVSGVTCRKENSEYTIGIDVNFKNQSEWDLSITSMRSIVYIDGQYVWGRSYDWLSNPQELPSRSERDIVLEIEVPDTKREIVATGGDAWQIRVSGLLDMPRLGTKPFVTEAVIPLERGNH